jgi:hypothetical protein
MDRYLSPALAKKARTPAPPRRVQAPKRRDVPSRAPTADAGRQRRLLYGFAAAGVVALAAVVLVIVLTGRSGGGVSDAKVAAAFRAAGGTFKTYPSQGRQHTSNINAKIPYNSFPPTSGEHYFVPAIWDQYDRPLSQVQVVHNLEHGGIVIQYGSRVPQSQLARITTFYRSDPNALLVAPLPALGNKIALTAWTHLGTLTKFNENAFTKFRDAFRYKGPEHFPPSALDPGE